MAKEISLKVTAEGVETLEQFKFVEGAGCDFVRGYYIARPLSEIDLIELLTQSHKPVLKAVGKTSSIKSRCRSNLLLEILGYFIIPGDFTKQAVLSGFDNLAQFTYLHQGPPCGLSAVNYETDQK